jgi:hypothetical protein
MEPFEANELRLHDPFILPDKLELEHEIEKPRYWYAHQLRLAGATWAEVAEALGYASGQSAHSAVKMALDRAEYPRQTSQEMLDLELERLDMLQLVHWRAARQGDIKATEIVLKISAQRAKLIGLGENNQYEDEKSDKNTVLIGGTEEEYIAGIKRAQALHRKPIEGEVAS